jgi:hypothetical protein
VVNNKYMATPRGVFAMRYFFDSAIGQQDAGEVMSAEAMRFKIKALIEREASDDVLSDDRIVEILRRERDAMVVIGCALDGVGLALPGIEVRKCDAQLVSVVVGDGDVDTVHAIAVALCGWGALRVAASAARDDERDGGTGDACQKRLAVQHVGRSPSSG